MTARHKPTVGESASRSLLNVWLNIGAILIPLLVTISGGLYALGRFTSAVDAISLKVDTKVGEVSKKVDDQSAAVSATVDKKVGDVSNQVTTVSTKVDTAAALAQAKVEALSAKVDSTAAAANEKVDALSARVESNHQDVVKFEGDVQGAFKQVFENQRVQTDKINAETIDRLKSGKK